MVRDLKFTPLIKVPEQLRSRGVAVLAYAQADVNGDGREDAVLAVATLGDVAPTDIWVLLNTADGLQALPVVAIRSDEFQLPQTAAEVTGLKVETFTSPDGKTLAAMLAGHNLYVFQIAAGQGALSASVKEALYTIEVKGYQIRQQGKILEMEVVRDSKSCQNCTDLFQQIDGRFRIVSPADISASKIAAAETALLVNGQPAQAIPLLQSALETGDQKPPDGYYLLGLAYELTGDEGNAVQAYWQILHEYPDTAYARMAQAKLEQK